MNKDLYYTLAIKLDLFSLLQFSITNRRINRICNQVWKYRLNSEFSDYKSLNLNKSFKEIYIILHQITILKDKTKREENVYTLYNTEGMYFCFNLSKIPKEIRQLKNLKHLTVCHNNLTNMENICNLFNLEILNLYGNKITHVSKEIENLSKLRYLYVSGNQLTEIPEEIGKLSKLEHLYLSNNRIKKLPKEIGQLSNLEELTLQSNLLKELPKEIGQLKNLQVLSLSSNTLVPKEIDLSKEVYLYCL